MAKLKVGERKNCEACGAPLVGARYTKTGNVAPICLIPNPEKGNILLWTDHETGEPTYAIVGDDAAVLYLREDLSVPLRINHFGDCTDADRFHKPKET